MQNTCPQDPSKHPFGGSNTGRRISLQPAICQIVSQCHRLAHPRSRSLLATYNSLYASVRNLDGKSFHLGNLYGTMVSKKTTNEVRLKVFSIDTTPPGDRPPGGRPKQGGDGVEGEG